MFTFKVLLVSLFMSFSTSCSVNAAEMFNDSVPDDYMDHMDINFKHLSEYDFDTCSSSFKVYKVTDRWYKLSENFTASKIEHDWHKDKPNIKGFRVYAHQIINHAKNIVLNTRQITTYGCTRLLNRVTSIDAESLGLFSFEVSGTFYAEMVFQLSQYNPQSSAFEVLDEYVVYRLLGYPRIIIEIYSNSTKFPNISNPLAVTSTANIIIASDPQPFRHPTCEDPNWDADCWDNHTQRSSDSFKVLCRNRDICIINGDMTEFGRMRTWAQSLHRFTDKFTFFGLGNHDYQNNVQDCHSGMNGGENGCARNSIFMLERQYPIMQKLLHGRNFWFDSDHRSNPQGSFAYGFDVTEKVHLIQANLEPKYEVNLTEAFAETINVRSSHDLLKTKIHEASAKGQIILLNYHLDNYADLNEYAEAAAGKLVLFHGHTHEAAVRHTPKVKVYDSGALFLGDFIEVKINGTCLEIKHGNAVDGVSKYHENICF